MQKKGRRIGTGTQEKGKPGEVFQKEDGKRQFPEESIQMLQKWGGKLSGGGGRDGVC